MAHLARNGVPSMIKIGQKLCQLIVKFTPVITAQYPTNAALLAALAAANAACAELTAQCALVREYGD
jgi:hypothetical protein